MGWTLRRVVAVNQRVSEDPLPKITTGGKGAFFLFFSSSEEEVIPLAKLAGRLKVRKRRLEADKR